MKLRKIAVRLTGPVAALLAAYAWLRGPQVVEIENTSNEVVDVEVELSERASLRGLPPGARRTVGFPGHPHRSSLHVAVNAQGEHVEVRQCGYIGNFPDVTHVAIGVEHHPTCERKRMAYFGL